jgi:hypothetical protein
VECLNKPGELARVTEAVAAKGINLTASSTLAWGEKGAVGFLTNDEPGTRTALEQAGLPTVRSRSSASICPIDPAPWRMPAVAWRPRG